MSEDLYNKDELVPPSWMNDEFFTDVLRKCENDDSIKVQELKITPGTGKGDHYASIMFRVRASYDSSSSKGQSKSMIIKAMPDEEGYKKDMVSESYVFETEIAMYSKVIPALEAELRRIGDNTILGARALYYALEPRKCIVFEDIVQKGYAALRGRLLNMEEAKVAILKLAKWHAASYKLVAEGDKWLKSFQKGLFSLKDFYKSPIIVHAVDDLIEKLETIEELKIYIPKLRSIKGDLIQRCVDSFNYCLQKDPEGIFVLCHGDFHAKNMMYKWNGNGDIEDIMLLDFQISSFGPAILDMVYAKYMLVGNEIRRNGFDELIYYYSTNFIDTLQKLGFQGECPKVADFYIEFFRHRHWDVFLAIAFLPFWTQQIFLNALEVDLVVTSDEIRKQMFSNEMFFEEITRLLPIMLHNGYLE